MGTIRFAHTVAQIDAAVDSIGSIAQRLGVAAIVPCTEAQYNAIETKDSNTLYIVYGAEDFRIFYGVLPLKASGGGGGDGGETGLALGLMHGTAENVVGQAIY